MIDYKDICEKTIDTVRNAARFIRAEHEKVKARGIIVKGQNDFVTHVDKGAEEIIVKELKELLPEAGFIAEEGTAQSNGEAFQWIIDPIDGTTNFIHGLAPHAISVALYENNKPVVGIVYELGLDELFYTYKGGKAYCNDAEISCSKADKISDSLIATGFPYNDFSKLDQFKKSMDYCMEHSHGLRRLGSAATDLAYVAAGRFEAFYEYGLKPWDVAAGAYLVQQAGGRLCDFSKGDSYVHGQELISACDGIFDEFSKVVSDCFSN